MTPRDIILARLVEAIVAIDRDRPLLVGIDGVDGAGKTRMAAELVERLQEQDAPVVSASVDSFHHPRAVRWERGTTSPEGFYYDSFNYEEMKRLLLSPFRHGTSTTYTTSYFDHRADQQTNAPLQDVPPNGVLIVDGIFLQRPELRDYWDLTIFLDVDFATTYARMAERDGGDPDPSAASNHRYRQGQMIYLAACDPRNRADIVINNNDIAQPIWTRPV